MSTIDHRVRRSPRLNSGLVAHAAIDDNFAAMTEEHDKQFADLDRWSTDRIVAAMVDGQAGAVAMVRHALPAIARAADAAASRLAAGSGRLIYVGAGTSGRLAVLDGVELTPTFGWPTERLDYCLAGGYDALLRSVEGAEDDRDAGRSRIETLSACAADVVIGVAASGNTPYTVDALAEARRRGALTIGIVSNSRGDLLEESDHALVAETGAEIISGSTRMKAGTAQKAILTTLSSTIMIRLGRVHGGHMVDMRVSNQKLRSRAVGIVAAIGGVSADEAETALAAADLEIKPAILLAKGATPEQADRLLDEHGGNLHAALTAFGART